MHVDDMLVRPLCTTCCVMLTTLLYHVLVPGRFAKRRCWGLRFCTCASHFLCGCLEVCFLMSVWTPKSTNLFFGKDAYYFYYICWMWITQSLWISNQHTCWPAFTQGGCASRNLWNYCNIYHYLNSVNFRRVSCSICDCDVRLQYLWLLVGCMHFGKA